MITLAIDTSSLRGSVALLRDDTPLVAQDFDRAHTKENLFGAIQRVVSEQNLAPRDIDLFAVGTGPGSFTGIRAGIAAAKGLALPGARPIKAVSSFDALALGALPQMPRDCQQMCVMCDARRDEVYFALYGRNGQRACEIRIGALETIADEVHSPIWFVSAEIERYGSEIESLLGGFAVICQTPEYPSAEALGRLAIHRYRADGSRGDDHIEPIYLRTPDYKKL